MDLGLKSLDDDQLVNLLNEAVTELLARDPFVQRAASNARQQIAEKYKITAAHELPVRLFDEAIKSCKDYAARVKAVAETKSHRG